jgi:hypothetical protein
MNNRAAAIIVLQALLAVAVNHRLGPRQDDFPDALQADTWQHIAVVMGTRGQVNVYLNGKELTKK